jgi:hypothetical protein
MSSFLRPGEIAVSYEALRAQATGRLPAVTPRGLSLVLGAGLAAWVKAWAQPSELPTVAPSPSALRPPAAPAAGRSAPAGAGDEVVRLLAEMALGCWAKLAVAS